MRVLFSHNYSMSEARRLWKLGTYPGQHLYGITEVEAAGTEVAYVPWQAPGRGPLARKLRWFAGDVRQEAWLARHARSGDVCYSGEPNGLAGLTRLRGMGAWWRPIVSVFHQEQPATRRGRAVAGGVDVAVCLSRRVARHLVEFHGRDPATTVTLPWGPDLEFAGYRSTGEHHVVSSGKTNRDLDTLLRALDRVRWAAKVYTAAPARHSWPAGVTAVPASRGHLNDSFAEVLPDLQLAAVVAIPLLAPRLLSGLTELNDALALGKPVLMTRNDYIDCDIEAIGCGRWIEPGDVDGWCEALDEMKDPERRGEMGRRAREFAETSWNSQLFGAGVVAALRAACG